MSVVPILMYHQVTPHGWPSFAKYTVTPAAFEAQMAWLAKARYKTIQMDQLLAYHAGHATLPARSVMITFDDGFQDCVNYAVPILQAYGFTATFFLVAGLVGKRSRWLVPHIGTEFALADWTAARQLEKAGFQCGAHGLNHMALTELSPSACQEELLQARLLLEDKLGHEVRDLAYPHGRYDERVRAIAQESGYRSACSVRIGRFRRSDDPLALPRVPVTGHDSLFDFAWRLHAAQTVGEMLHSGLDAGRYFVKKALIRPS